MSLETGARSELYDAEPCAAAGEEQRIVAKLPAPDTHLRVAVVVPARDEAARIEACLTALANQQAVGYAEYEVIVVLDGCRDATGDKVRKVVERESSLRLHVLELPVSLGVGHARRQGMDIACERLLSLGRSDGLIASTDADSVVAEDWLICQLELVGRGARAIGGHIELDREEADALSPQALSDRELRARARRRGVLSQHPHGAGEHHQFSGASLALTAHAYRSCGGLPVQGALEDEAMEHELRARGVPIHRSLRVRVKTSARTDGRTPRGLAHDLARSDWRARRSYAADQFPLERLLEAKRSSIALVLPAREVATTIGPIADQAARMHRAGLLDEVLVVDAGSRDGSAQIAHEAGLAVVQEDELSSEVGPCRGKGDAMWRALKALDSDIVAFADTDTEEFGEHFLTGLLGPLICEPAVQLVKGFFRRPFRTNGTFTPDGGGRVTELMARPLLNLHAPELSVFDQPLAGETAARRELLEQIPFSAGYGVEIAMLIDVWRITGLDGLAQVDLGVRQNRHQTLRELSAMAYAVLVAAQTRFLGSDFAAAHACGSICLPAVDGGGAMESRAVVVQERPPAATIRRFAVTSQGSEQAVGVTDVHFPRGS